jgi:hypothetical protein
VDEGAERALRIVHDGCINVKFGLILSIHPSRLVRLVVSIPTYLHKVPTMNHLSSLVR